METEEKIRLLMGQALSDREGEGLDRPLRDLAAGFRARQPLDPINIRSLRVRGTARSPASPDADRGYGPTRLFRILLTNACSFSCDYCPMRAGRSIPRHALSPESLADVFLTAWRRGWVSGLFVTTGIPKSPRWAMDRLIELVEILRLRRGYAGYLHAKAVSGAEPEQIDRLTDLCDRVSYNLEAACQATLDRVAPEKSFAQGLALLARVRDRARSIGRRRPKGDPRPDGPANAAGVTAQFVVGIGSETDHRFLATTHRLWRERMLHHPHFAAFRPIEDTPLEGERETPMLRENRLYQADYLVRRYGFEPQELVYGGDGNLPLSRDPKLQWALAHPEKFPVEASTADRETLLRVPGLGPTTVTRLLAARRTLAAFDLAGLRRLGAATRRAAGFLAWRGRTLGTKVFQETLFPPEDFPEPSQVYTFSPGTFR
jgi:predicted DNA-binding helix-hairpin-helix protein